jgi:MFS family permease
MRNSLYSLPLEEALQQVGAFGRYQNLVCFVTFCVNLFGGAFAVSLPIMLAKPELKCSEDECSCDSPYTLESLNGSNFATEMQLVCAQESLIPFISASFIGGCIFGAVVYSCISSWIGRRVLLVWTVRLFEVGLFIGVLCPSAAFMAGLVFVLGALMACMTLGAFCMVVEVVTLDHRIWFCTAVLLGWSVGGVVFSLIAIVLSNWRHQLAALAVLGLFVSLLVLLLDESPRCLAASGNYMQARKVLQQIARTNSKPEFNDTLQGETVLCHQDSKSLESLGFKSTPDKG